MACGYPSRFQVVRQTTSIKRQMEIKLSVLHVSEGEKAWPYTILATCHDALLHSYTRDDETGLRGREGRECRDVVHRMVLLDTGQETQATEQQIPHW